MSEQPKKKTTRKRATTKKKPTKATSASSDLKAVLAKADLPDLPPAIVEGRSNPEHHRAKFALLTKIEVEAMLGQRELGKGVNLEHIRKSFVDECRLAGFDAKHIADARTDEEKALDCCEQLSRHVSSLMEFSDGELDAIERTMENAYQDCEEHIRTKRLTKQQVDDLGKVRSVLKKVRALREKARTPVYKTPTSDLDRAAQEASHLARFMVYTMRSNLFKDRVDNVLQFASHHIKALVDIWEAENGILFIPADTHLDPKAEIRWNEIEYEGIILMMPPGHGKTVLATGWTRRHLCLNPHAQGTWLHASSDKAKDAVNQVKAAFVASNEDGRRTASLYPGLKLSDTDNGAGKLKIDKDKPLKDPNLAGAGVTTKGLGIDNRFQIRDDIVDIDDRFEETTRERRWSALGGTWETRLRGAGCFRFNIGYYMHHDDAMARLEREARRASKHPGQGMLMRVSKQRIGRAGDEWYPLWPEVYPRKVLKQKAAGNDIRVFDANYRLNPNPESTRIIKALRYYDPNTSDHRGFVASSDGYLSLDPSGTNRESSDRAGIVYGAINEVSTRVREESGDIIDQWETQLRICQADQVGANQSELVELGATWCEMFPIGNVIVEVNSGFYATSEMWQNNYGITPIEAKPGNKKKGDRLRRVSVMIDDGIPGNRACVLFPGKTKRDDSGNPVLDEAGEPIVIADPDRWGWLYDQLLSFGAVSDDHAVDAIVNLANETQEKVGVGVGILSRRIKQVRSAEKPRHILALERAKAHMREAARAPFAGDSYSDDAEDLAFFNARYN